MNQRIEVLPDVAALVQRAEAWIVPILQAAIAQHGRATIALAGGSTPQPLYERLARTSLPWEQLHIFWGDERYVPADHPDSNYRMARLAWLDRVPLPAANLHPMPTDAADPSLAAQRYESELQRVFQLAPGEFPRFDVILLGMGDDAHTASLFPHTAALQVCDRAVTVGNKDGQPRLTLTVPVINMANTVLFLVAGANKQTALQQVFALEADADTYPARLIRPQGTLVWLLDQTAAAGIPNREDLIQDHAS